MQIKPAVRKIVVFAAMAWLLAAVLAGSFFRVESDRKAEERFIRERARFGLASVSVSRAIAAQAYQEELDDAARHETLDVSPLARQIVRRTAEPVIAVAGKLYPHAADWKWEIHIVTSTEVNAWCMDGGKIVVYTGLLDLIDYNQNKLAAVLAHEVSHALLEHGRATLSRSWSLDSAFWILSKSLKMGAIRTAAAENGIDHALFMAGQRRDETEADLLGLEILSKAGFDPADGIGLWRDMAAGEGPRSRLALKAERFLSDHPVDEDRVAALGKLLDRARTLAEKAPEQKSWLVDSHRLKDDELDAVAEASSLYGMEAHFRSKVMDPLLPGILKSGGVSRGRVIEVMNQAQMDQLDRPDSYYAYSLALARENAGDHGVLSAMNRQWETWQGQHGEAGSLLDHPELCTVVFQAPREAGICSKTVKDITFMTEQEGGRYVFGQAFLNTMAVLDKRFTKARDEYAVYVKNERQNSARNQSGATKD